VVSKEEAALVGNGRLHPGAMPRKPTYVSDELDWEAAPDGDDGHLDSLEDLSPQEPTALHGHVSLHNPRRYF
jgi:hypothetical protein